MADVMEDGTDNSNGERGGEKAIGLKRELGLMSGTSLIVGTMIGSGIFVSPSGALSRSGSVGMSLLVWTGSGILSILASLSYIELGTVVPESGGEYSYFNAAFGAIPAFVYAWINLVTRPASMTITCLAFANYVVAGMLGRDRELPQMAVKLFAAVTICLIAAINGLSVQFAARVQNTFTIAKLVAIAIIIIAGIVQIANGKTEHLQNPFEGSKTSFSDIAMASYNCLWSYEGWNNLNYVTEELKNPYRNLPLSIMIALPLVTLCYIAVNVAYFTVMSPEEVMSSSAVAVGFGNKVLGSFALLMPLGVALSTFGAANGSEFTAGRITYVASRNGHMVDFLSYVDVKRNTPTLSVVFLAILSLLLLIPGDLGSLIELFSFTTWIFYGLVMIAIIVLRFRRTSAYRPFKVWVAIPILVLCSAIYLIVAPTVENLELEYLYVALFILLGVLVYLIFIKLQVKLCNVTERITILLQKIFVAAPSDIWETAPTKSVKSNKK